MSNHTIVITGASSGIGEALAYAMTIEKVHLILFARRKEKLETVAQKCRELGSLKVSIQVGDVCKKEDVIKLKEKIAELCGEITLVNNAGLFKAEEFHKMSLEAMDEMVMTNLLGVFYTTHALLPIMLEKGVGQIINISSIAAKTVFPGCSVYSATKAALLSFSQILSSEVRSKGIRVCSILPGMTHTEIWDHLDEKTKSRILTRESVAERIKDIIMLPKGITVDEITITPPDGSL